jgi:MFS family permease
MLRRIETTWREYPRQFWTLFFGSLINAAGGGLVFPFFSLYLTRQLGFSMIEVGFIFAAYAAISMVAQLVGGVLVDRVGRKPVMLFSLFGNAAAILCLGLTAPLVSSSALGKLAFVSVIVVLMGLTGAIFGPAVNAMIADLIGSEKRSQAFGLLRVVQNLGIAIGPAIGGFIAARSYEVLFAVAAIAAAIFGVIIALRARETRPQVAATVGLTRRPEESWGRVLSDQVFILFMGLYLVMAVVYSQMNTTLPVFLNKSYTVTEQWYGLLMSLNAAMVVLFQFPITRFTDRFARTAMMALGGAFFAVGFGMFGFVGVLPLFFLAQATWTVGEMLTSPVSQAFVADVAPETMRGRYMGVFGLVWTIGYGAGPLLGGAMMDKFDGRYIWYAAFALNGLAALGFLALGRWVKRPAVPATDLSPVGSQWV